MARIIEGRLAYAEDLTRIFRQVVGAVLLSWQRVLRAALITASIVWSITEIVACVVTSSFPPPAVTHLVAVALAFAVGYGVALTLLLGMLLHGGVRFIRQLEGEVEVGARVASVFVRREAGGLGATLRRIAESGEPKFNAANMAALRRTSGKPVAKPRASYGSVASAAVAAVGLDVARASVRQTPSPSVLVAALPYNARPDTRRDPDDAIIRAPAPDLPSLPVLAAHLPRIEWVYDEKPPPVTRPFAPASVEHDDDVPSVPVLAASLPSSDLIAAQDSPEFSAASDTSSETGTTATPDVPGLIPRGYRADSSTRPLPAITRPLSANTRPLPPPDDSRVPGGTRSGGLWERVSQALVGQSAPSEYDARQDDPPIVGEVMPEDAWLYG
ncbi:MAG TPA: hypothetical protein VFS83_19725 [Ktedonobacterales bacterium]|nr:hypothetical protein [Ktedonobacterales bacterium]